MALKVGVERRGIARRARFKAKSLAEDSGQTLSGYKASLRVFLLVLLVSALMGVAARAFLLALDAATAFREEHPVCFLFLPVVGVVTALLYHGYGKRAARGNNLVIETALHGGLIRARMAVLTFCCSVATHLVGGSAGREGAAVQIGGTIASNVSNKFHLDERDNRYLMLAGISAAFGGVFGTPLAGAFFGMEMCYVGKLEYSAALYCLVASFMGDTVAQVLGAEHTFQSIAHVHELDWGLLAVVALCAALFGLLARLFSFSIRQVKAFYAKHLKNYVVRALVGSLVLLGAYALLGGWDYAGFAEWLVEAGFDGDTTPLDTLLKLLYTALTVGAGFQGGEVTPLFGMGASLGGWIGQTFLGDPSFMAAIGMLSMFAGALNVPITAIMLGIDMFGGASAGYYIVAAFVSYFVAGHHSLYPAQQIVTPKRRTLSDDESLTVDEAMRQHREDIDEAVEEKLAVYEEEEGRQAEEKEDGYEQ